MLGDSQGLDQTARMLSAYAPICMVRPIRFITQRFCFRCVFQTNILRMSQLLDLGYGAVLNVAMCSLFLIAS